MAASQVETETTTWDLSQALNLLSSLCTPPGASKGILPEQNQNTTDTHSVATTTTTATAQTRTWIERTKGRSSVHKTTVSNRFDKPQPLGDFKNVFQYLGTGGQSLATLEDSPFEHFATKLDYASDGATYIGVKKALETQVAWADGTDIDDGNITTDRSASPPRNALSKKARWRRNQRIKKGLHRDQNMLVSDSEADSVFKKTPARKASAHIMRNGSLPPVHIPDLNSTTETIAHPTPGSAHDQVLAVQGSARSPSPQKPLSPILDKEAPRTPTQSMLTQSKSRAEEQEEGEQVTPIITPGDLKVLPVSSVSSLCFRPASVQPTPTKSSKANLSANSSLLRSTLPSTPQPKYSVAPKVVRSGADRNWALLLKIIDQFPEDREYLVSPMNMTNHNNHPSGIHIFVDASNIFIGFWDQLKRSRGIPPHYHMPKMIPPSFDALALLIERRRPVAKRVLVGSAPEVPAFQKARSVGYEVSILQKVLKARELTERQIFYRDRDLGLIARNVKPPPHGRQPEVQAYASGSESPAPQYAKEAYVEQGVDEILHLKILESLVDCESPSTVVLATGDAAMAEYSQGFMAMVERALNKGWRIELCSWSKNISSMYKSPRFLKKWEQRFKIIYLDEFAEELLDM